MEPGPTEFVSVAGQRARWGGAVDPGLLIVPDILIRYQDRLGLEAVDLVVLLNIITQWECEGGWPMPRLPAIANRMNVHKRTIERSIAKMEQAGLLSRRQAEKGKATLAAKQIDLSGLQQRLVALSDHEPQTAFRRRALAS